MNKYILTVGLALFSTLMLLTAGSVFAQNQTSDNQSAGMNTTGTMNATSMDSSMDESGQVSGGVMPRP